MDCLLLLFIITLYNATLVINSKFYSVFIVNLVHTLLEYIKIFLVNGIWISSNYCGLD